MTVDWTLRWVPRNIWVRLIFTPRSEMEPGHDWRSHGIIRRDAWRIGPIGFAILRLPCIRTKDCRERRRYARGQARSIRRANRTPLNSRAKKPRA